MNREMGGPAFDQISFVVQGPIERAVSGISGKPTTQTCLESIRKWFPGSEIVLSTWNGSDVAGLTFDRHVESTDPGPVCITRPEVSPPIYNNDNRQILSTKAGLRAAGNRYALKVRSDIVVTGNQWLSCWDRYPGRVPEWRMFQERIVTANLFTRNPLRKVRKPFHPSDWFMFGLKEDLLLLWDIDPEPEPETSHWFRDRPTPRVLHDFTNTRRYLAEQYLWKTLMTKFGEISFDHFADASRENVRLTQLSFANNLIILDVEQLGFYLEKYGDPPRSFRYSCLSHREWERLYRQYCLGQKMGPVLNRLGDSQHLYEALYLSIPEPVRSCAYQLSTFRRQLAQPGRAG